MIVLNCPACGASVTFRSKASVFCVCSFCKSTLVRQDMDLVKLGEMSELQDEMSFLQIGTFGKYEDRRFEIIGRLRVAYSDGFWNEWYSLFNDGTEGWLAEAQGFYAMCFPVVSNGVPAREMIEPGLKVNLKALGIFEVEDIREVYCIYSEGELPINAVKGRESLSVDLSDSNNRMATIEYADSSIRVFAGSYMDFDQFRFVNLRHIDGW